MNTDQTQELEETGTERQTQVDALAKVVSKVQADAATDSQKYLDESVVPKGGE